MQHNEQHICNICSFYCCHVHVFSSLCFVSVWSLQLWRRDVMKHVLTRLDSNCWSFKLNPTEIVCKIQKKPCRIKVILLLERKQLISQQE